MAYQPKMTKEINGDNPFIRAYFFLWPIDPDRLNTCWLFWGTILSPVNILLRAILAPLYFLGRLAGRPVVHKLKEWDENREKPIVNWADEREKKRKRQQRWENVLNFMSPLWRVIRWPLAGIGTLAVIFGLYLLVRLCWEHPANFGQVMMIIGFYIVGLCILLGLIVMIHETKLGRWLKEFWDLLVTGYWSFKNRTCARYVITEDQE